MNGQSFITLIILCVTTQSKPENSLYGMVIDAGSTHSQLFIYSFICDLNPKLSPTQISFSSSIDPISSLQNQDECDTLISSLITFAKEYLSDYKNEWARYPIYLKA
eukprot:146954_1